MVLFEYRVWVSTVFQTVSSLRECSTVLDAERERGRERERECERKRVRLGKKFLSRSLRMAHRTIDDVISWKISLHRNTRREWLIRLVTTSSLVTRFQETVSRGAGSIRLHGLQFIAAHE